MEYSSSSKVEYDYIYVERVYLTYEIDNVI